MHQVCKYSETRAKLIVDGATGPSRTPIRHCRLPLLLLLLLLADVQAEMPAWHGIHLPAFNRPGVSNQTWPWA